MNASALEVNPKTPTRHLAPALHVARRSPRPDKPLSYVMAARDARAIDAYVRDGGHTWRLAMSLRSSLRDLGRLCVRLSVGGVVPLKEARAELSRRMSRPSVAAHLAALRDAGVIVDRGDDIELVHFAILQPGEADPFWEARRAHQRAANRARQARHRLRRHVKLVSTAVPKNATEPATCGDVTRMYLTDPSLTVANATTRPGLPTTAKPRGALRPARTAVRASAASVRVNTQKPIPPAPSEAEIREVEDLDVDAAFWARLGKLAASATPEDSEAPEPAPTPPQERLRRPARAASTTRKAQPPAEAIRRVQAILEHHTAVFAGRDVNLLALAAVGAPYDTLRQACEITVEAMQAARHGRRGAVRNPGAFLLETTRNLHYQRPPRARAKGSTR